MKIGIQIRSTLVGTRWGGKTPVRTELGEEKRQQYLWALLASQLSQIASSWLNEKLPRNTRWRVIKEDTRNQLLASADACVCTADHIGIGKHTHRYATTNISTMQLDRPISPCHPHKELGSNPQHPCKSQVQWHGLRLLALEDVEANGPLGLTGPPA